LLVDVRGGGERYWFTNRRAERSIWSAPSAWGCAKQERRGEEGKVAGLKAKYYWNRDAGPLLGRGGGSGVFSKDWGLQRLEGVMQVLLIEIEKNEIRLGMGMGKNPAGRKVMGM